MSYQTAKYYPLNKWAKKGIFAGGYVDNVADIDMAPYYSPYLRNCRLDWQSITIRPWFQDFVELAAGDYPRGAGVNTATSVMVVRHNISLTEKLYNISTAGALTAISTGVNIASDNRMRFYNVGSVIYCMNGSDAFGKLSGTTYSNPWTVPGSFAPSFGAFFDGKLVTNNVNVNNKVYYSVADNYEDFTSAGTDTGTLNEQLTWLVSTWQALFYFTPNTIAVTDRWDIVNTAGTISYNSTYLQVKEWAKYHDCIVAVWANVFYLSSSNSLVRVQRQTNNLGFETVELSDRPYAGIGKIMSTLGTDQSKARAMYYEKEQIIKRHLVTQWASYPDLCIIYDLTKDAFLVDTQKYFYGGVTFNGNYYTLSAITPNIFQDEYGQDDTWQPIPFEYRTKKFYVSGGEFKNLLWETRTLLDINELAQVTQTIFLDNTQIDTSAIDSDNIPIITWWIGTEDIGTYEIGTDWLDEEIDSDYYEVVRLRTKGSLNKKGRTLQWRRTNDSLAGKVRLKNVVPRLDWQPPESTPLT